MRFRDATGAVIPHEMDGESDDGLFWVRVPSYLGASTTIYVEYGGTPVAASTDSVWSNRFFGVWHMQDNVAIRDSSPIGRNTSPSGSVQRNPGMFGNGFEFDPPNEDYLQVDGTTGTLTGITMSGWMRPDRRSMSPSQHGALVTRQFAATGEDDFWLGLSQLDRSAIALTTDGTSSADDGPAIQYGVWTHLVGTWDSSSGTTTIYVNGNAVTDAVHPGPGLPDSGHPIFIGGGNNAINGKPDFADDDFFDGILDEVRLVNEARSPDWVAAEHASETDAVITYGPVAHF